MAGFGNNIPGAELTDEKLNAFIAGAQAKIAEYHAKHFPNVPPNVLTATRGPVYTRILSKTHADDQHGSAWAFIRNADGAILKPAGWKTPAKHARGNVNTETHGVEFVGPHGPAYLK